ncbi:MAG: helix-turn-helix transcriptional regulator [Candidatus Thorarchaeota archaeon]|jgi:predicted DNA-binding transcriptional regulator AlpA
MISQNTYIPAAVSMSQMARLLDMSRSRFYQLISQGILLPPIYSLSSRRPYYTREMAQENLEVKKNNVGINGQVIIFYSSKNKLVHTVNKVKTVKTNSKKETRNSQYSYLVDGLEALGMTDVKSRDIEKAIADCFPDGTKNVDQDEILKAVFRHLHRRNTEHKQRA